MKKIFVTENLNHNDLSLIDDKNNLIYFQYIKNELTLFKKYFKNNKQSVIDTKHYLSNNNQLKKLENHFTINKIYYCEKTNDYILQYSTIRSLSIQSIKEYLEGLNEPNPKNMSEYKLIAYICFNKHSEYFLLSTNPYTISI